MNESDIQGQEQQSRQREQGTAGANVEATKSDPVFR